MSIKYAECFERRNDSFSSLVWRLLKLATYGAVIISMVYHHQPSLAQPPYQANLVDGGNRWVLDAYDDADPDHVALASPSICFTRNGVVGTHQRYTWYSDSFFGWRGVATQEGDQIFMTGEYAGGLGQDAVQVQIIIDSPRNGAVGHWQEWRQGQTYGETVGYANARMIRDGDCTITADMALNPSNPPDPAANPMTFVTPIP